MAINGNVIGAFGEEHAAILAGASVYQLRQWDSIGLLKPSYGSGHTGLPYGRIYSFRDLVSLRVLNELHNIHKISYKHLKEVQQKMASLSDAPWASTKLELLGKRVVIVEARTGKKTEPVSGQRVFAIPLKIIIKDIRSDVKRLNIRNQDDFGQVVRAKFTAQNQSVIAGTRIPVGIIKDYFDAGYDEASIIREFPDLTVVDVQAAISFSGDDIAA